MNQKINELIKQAGTDCSGKWMSVDNAHIFADLIIKEIEQYINESSGDIDYVRFLINRNFENLEVQR